MTRRPTKRGGLVIAQSGTVIVLPGQGHYKRSARGGNRKTGGLKNSAPHQKGSLLVWGAAGLFNFTLSTAKARKKGKAGRTAAVFGGRG